MNKENDQTKEEQSDSKMNNKNMQVKKRNQSRGRIDKRMS